MKGLGVIISIQEMYEYLSERDSDCTVIDNKNWFIKVDSVNGFKWYRVYRKTEHLLFEDSWEYLTERLTEALDYCNSEIEDSFYYY